MTTTNDDRSTTHDAAKRAMTEAAEAVLRGDPRAVEMTERALAALRAAQGGDR